jgi:hypothetical protein
MSLAWPLDGIIAFALQPWRGTAIDSFEPPLFAVSSQTIEQRAEHPILTDGAQPCSIPEVNRGNSRRSRMIGRNVMAAWNLESRTWNNVESRLRKVPARPNLPIPRLALSLKASIIASNEPLLAEV